MDEKPFTKLSEYIFALGKVTIAATAIEIYLDFITAVVFERAGGNKGERTGVAQEVFSGGMI